MALKLIATLRWNDYTAKVYRDAEWGEYRVKFYEGAAYLGEGSDYHTLGATMEDRKDAVGTAYVMMESLDRKAKKR